jgi:hypothetical protein
MALYTPTSFLKLMKQDIGIKNIVLPINDDALYERFCESALKEFSVRSPRVLDYRLTDNERIRQQLLTNGSQGPLLYRIPKHYYLDSEILTVLKVDVARPLGYSDLYVPQGMYASPDSVLESIGDIRVAAGVASAMGKALTHEFIAPDIIRIFNGWSSATLDVKLGLLHDKSLSTIQPTQFTILRTLGILDLQEYLYGELGRIDKLDIGIGSIDLQIDRWSDAGDKKREYLNTLDEDSSLNIDGMLYF